VNWLSASKTCILCVQVLCKRRVPVERYKYPDVWDDDDDGGQGVVEDKHEDVVVASRVRLKYVHGHAERIDDTVL